MDLSKITDIQERSKSKWACPKHGNWSMLQWHIQIIMVWCTL